MLKALLLSIALLVPSLAESQEPRHRAHRHTRQVVKIAGAAAAAYVAKAVDFDGTNDYLTRGADLTGNADGQQGTFSVWLRIDGGDGTKLRIYSDNAGDNETQRRTGNDLQLAFKNAGGTTILRQRTVTNVTTSSTWHHLLVSWDLSVPEAHIFLNDVSDDDAVRIETNDTIDYTKSDHGVGARTNGDSKWNGCLSELYLNVGEFLDITVESNRRKFRDADGKPVDLGSDGSTPTGTAPIIYLNGDSTDFQTNQGSGGNFTVTGSLSDCSTSPSD